MSKECTHEYTVEVNPVCPSDASAIPPASTTPQGSSITPASFKSSGCEVSTTITESGMAGMTRRLWRATTAPAPAGDGLEKSRPSASSSTPLASEKEQNFGEFPLVW
jgi:hypothetical protein